MFATSLQCIPGCITSVGRIIMVSFIAQIIKESAVTHVPLGDVVYFSAMGHEFIILDSMEAITDLMFKRAPIYSGKPHSPMLGDLFVQILSLEQP